MSDIEATFHQDMLNIYEKSVEIGYRPSYFLRMVNEHGGVEAAHRLLASDTSTKGFQRLLELERLDLTAEALILKPEYATLFSEEEREKARKRLADLGYTAPWDQDKRERDEAELEDTSTDETLTTDTLAAWQAKIAALAILRKADVQRNGATDIPSHQDAKPTAPQLERVFAPGTPLQIPPMGAFRHRLHELLLERGV